MRQIYADNAATTKISKKAAEMLAECNNLFWANTSSGHSFGRKSAEKLDEAREMFAARIGCRADEVYFTSGGSESDTQAIITAARLGEEKSKKHIVTSEFEHHAVLETLEKLKSRGFEITYVSPNADGVVSSDDVKIAIREDTCLVTVMYVNNELGTVQPIERIGEICRERGIVFHTDAVAAAGYLPIDVNKAGVDMLSMSAHKFHGPKGVGLLYARRGIKPEKLIFGGGQENGSRAGTSNLPSIAAAAVAYSEVCEGFEQNTQWLSEMRNMLAEGLLKIDGAHINGSMTERVPGNLNIGFDRIEGEILAVLLDEKGIYVSTGSACTSGVTDVSYVLKSIGCVHGGIRISLSPENTKDDVAEIVTAVTEICRTVGQLENILG